MDENLKALFVARHEAQQRHSALGWSNVSGLSPEQEVALAIDYEVASQNLDAANKAYVAAIRQSATEARETP